MATHHIDTLRWQFQLTWKLASEYHLPHLTDRACVWEPAPGAWNVRQANDGSWHHDWSDVEPNPAPPITIGWITWQMIWWWSGALAALRGEAPRAHHEVSWPGSAASTRTQLEALAREWTDALALLTDEGLERPLAYPWPDPQPLRLTLAWANAELMKNVAEIGCIRHLFEAQPRRSHQSQHSDDAR